MRISRILTMATATVAAVAAPAWAQRFDYQGTMNGAQVVPGPGAANGSGTFKISIDNASNQVCFDLAWQGIDQPNAAHIHIGNPNEAGQIMQDLNFPANGPKGCLQTDPTTIGHMTGGPKAHYVDLHNGAFPEGAVRGQLQQ